MKKFSLKLGILFLSVFFIANFLAPYNFAEDAASQGEAVAVKVAGTVKYIRAPWWNFWAWQVVKPGTQFLAGDRVQIGANGELDLKFPNNTYVRVFANTSVAFGKSSIETNGQNPEVRTAALNLKAGEVWVKAEKGTSNIWKFKVETPNVIAGVKGTAFKVAANRKETGVMVGEGTVEVKQRKSDETVLVDAGFETKVVGRSKPAKPYENEHKEQEKLLKWGNEAEKYKNYVPENNPAKDADKDVKDKKAKDKTEVNGPNNKKDKEENNDNGNAHENDGGNNKPEKEDNDTGKKG